MTPLEALLTHLIDYAGLYPPAALGLPAVIENYERYLNSRDSWILNRLVLPAARLNELALAPDWRITLLVDSEPGRLPPQIETLETKSAERFSLPTYCEVPLDQITDAYAKVRTGGLTPEAIPSSAVMAEFLHQAAARRTAFKATAGLHHPIRASHALTYASDSPCATMHGFVNVFAAAALAWQGMDVETLTAMLDEPDSARFQFDDDHLRWRRFALSTEQILAARRDFAHSFGSCSFEEPLQDLRNLGWLR